MATELNWDYISCNDFLPIPGRGPRKNGEADTFLIHGLHQNSTKGLIYNVGQRTPHGLGYMLSETPNNHNYPSNNLDSATTIQGLKLNPGVDTTPDANDEDTSSLIFHGFEFLPLGNWNPVNTSEYVRVGVDTAHFEATFIGERISSYDIIGIGFRKAGQRFEERFCNILASETTQDAYYHDFVYFGVIATGLSLQFANVKDNDDGLTNFSLLDSGVNVANSENFKLSISIDLDGNVTYGVKKNASFSDRSLDTISTAPTFSFNLGEHIIPFIVVHWQDYTNGDQLYLKNILFNKKV